MQNASVIVCEKTGNWAVALNRSLRDVKLRQTRSMAQCMREASYYPASLLVLELTKTNLTEVLACLTLLAQQFRDARAVVVTSSDSEDREWLVREAGAVHVITSPRQVVSLSQLIQRHLAAVPKVEMPPTERIRKTLPWNNN